MLKKLTARARRRRWSDNDRHWGVFTYSRDANYKSFSVVLCSGEEENRGCSLRLSGFGRTLIIETPSLIKPWREKHTATIGRMGRDWYFEEHERRFGFSYGQGFLQVFHGALTHDSTTDRTWCKHLPWTQWRFHRLSLYGLQGEHLRSWIEPRRRNRKGGGVDRFREQHAFEEKMPKVAFLFDDFDGERIRATTHVEEREWTFGDGWFQWLRFFRRNLVRRSLVIKFDKEVGPEKGSWKGGKLGHGIEMLPGELHEGAFRRYCEQEQRSKYRPFHLTCVGRDQA